MIYYCLGMPSSASTWAYNVVRAILQAGDVQHLAFRGETFGDFMGEIPADATDVVIKGHRGQDTLLPIFKMAGVKPLLTVRDPRDATTSLVQRFQLHVGAAAMQMNRSVANLITAAETMPYMVFYFEDRPSEHAESIIEIARFLGARLSDRQAEEIFDRFKAARVKEFIDNLDKLPKDRQRPGGKHDLDTQFHKTHITDMKIGKWMSHFDFATAGELERLFSDYARFFAGRGLGEGAMAPRGGAPTPFVLEFSSGLFRPVNSIDTFRRHLPARETIDANGMRVLEHIYLPNGRWELQLDVDLPSAPRIVRAWQQRGRVIAQASNSRTLRFVRENRLCSLPIDCYVEFDGMHDLGDAPPPAARLTARRIG